MVTRQMTLHTSLTATATEALPWPRRPGLVERSHPPAERSLPRAERTRVPLSRARSL